LKSIVIDGVETTILHLGVNAQYSCRKDCYHKETCDLRRETSLEPRESGFTATTLILNLKNLSEKVWPFILAWELIDNDGFAYPAFNLCNQIDLHSVAVARKYRALNTKHWNISPDTQINAILLFPELDKGKKISRISNCNYDIINSIQIEEMNESVSLEFEQKKRKRQWVRLFWNDDARSASDKFLLKCQGTIDIPTSLWDGNSGTHIPRRPSHDSGMSDWFRGVQSGLRSIRVHHL
jgi:hypothetical protein